MYELDPTMRGVLIQNRREELNLSRDQLAEMLGITSKFLGDIEHGNRGPSLKTLIRLCDVLNLSADYILFGDSKQFSSHSILWLVEKCPDEKKDFLFDIIRKIVESYME